MLTMTAFSTVSAMRRATAMAPPEEMPQKISDEVLHTYVTIGTYDQIAEKLLQRYGGVVTHCEFSIAVKDDADKERLRVIARKIQAK